MPLSGWRAGATGLWAATLVLPGGTVATTGVALGAGMAFVCLCDSCAAAVRIVPPAGVALVGCAPDAAFVPAAAPLDAGDGGRVSGAYATLLFVSMLYNVTGYCSWLSAGRICHHGFRQDQ